MSVFGFGNPCPQANLPSLYTNQCRGAGLQVTGNELLAVVDDINRRLGVVYVKLSDASKITICKREVGFALLRILLTGTSWYQAHGYLPEPAKLPMVYNIMNESCHSIVEQHHVQSQQLLQQQLAEVQVVINTSLLDLLPVESKVAAFAVQVGQDPARWSHYALRLNALFLAHNGQVRDMVKSLNFSVEGPTCDYGMYQILLNISGIGPRLQHIVDKYAVSVVKYYV